jgi:AcrR family transcriptional regulator
LTPRVPADDNSESGSDFAAEAGISPANLHRYYRNEQEILFFRQDRSIDRMIAALRDTRRSRARSVTRFGGAP